MCFLKLECVSSVVWCHKCTCYAMISLTVSITVSAGCRLAGGVARMDRARQARGDVYSRRLAPGNQQII